MNMSTMLTGLGLGLCGLVFLQMTFVVWGSFKNFFLETIRKRNDIKLLREQVRLAQLQYEERKTEKMESWIGVRKFEVRTIRRENDLVGSFYLYPHDCKPLPNFMPGQFLTFNLNIDGQDSPVVRCYSLSDEPRDDYFRVSIKKLGPPPKKPDAPPGLSSNYFNNAVKEGDILDVKAPAGDFYLDPNDLNPVVLIGGGVGITPVFSMLQAIVSKRVDREVWFFNGIRCGKEHTFKEDLKQIAAKHANVRIFNCYSDPEPEDKEGEDYDVAERVSVDLFKKLLPSNNYNFYTCGPPPMMTSITEGLEAWGVPKEHIHFEAFGPASVKKPAKKAAPKEGAKTFTISFTKSGKEIPWTEDCGSLLDVAEENGLSINSGCRAGGCGTCAVAIRSGEVDYLKEPSFPVEDGSCLACVSVPKGDLEIDS